VAVLKTKIMKNIAVVAGGNSSEYVISVQSGKMLVDEIRKAGYNTFLIEIRYDEWNAVIDDKTIIPIDRGCFEFEYKGEKIKFDCIVIAIHGTPGEDGRLQSYFDLVKIPYISCGVFSSVMTFNKYACKIFLKDQGIKSAPAILLNKKTKYNTDYIIQEIGLPCIVKPNESGSSFGVSKIDKKENLENAINEAFTESEDVIVEKFIKGIEVTCGMVNLNGEDIVFPITEVVSKKEFFDYEAKYTTGMSEEITPARISVSIEKKIKETTSQIYHALRCKGITRTDYIISNDEVYFLEVNTIPGMSPHSIIPKQLKTMNIAVSDIYNKMIEESLKR